MLGKEKTLLRYSLCNYVIFSVLRHLRHMLFPQGQNPSPTSFLHQILPSDLFRSIILTRIIYAHTDTYNYAYSFIYLFIYLFI